VLLAGVPRKGEQIRLPNGIDGPALVVEHVLWMGAPDTSNEPDVIVVVRPHPSQPEL
jgi:hypothetical protein